MTSSVNGSKLTRTKVILMSAKSECSIFIFWQLNYKFLKSCVENGPVEAMQHSWIEKICKLIPEHLCQGKKLHELMQELFEEVRSDYESSMRKSMGNWKFIVVLIVNSFNPKMKICYWKVVNPFTS